ncbi:MAG: lipid A export permease/ATP-binding protein MsbA [Xanthomonadales bacterium]|nr:lipid A export permease/ATP-binding protein MsbA [Xanthomonadales bacterium]MCB1634102.1 lipid A export permease/ATP-binding protein MsbA [Xanthomonadales bacterium]
MSVSAEPAAARGARSTYRRLLGWARPYGWLALAAIFGLILEAGVSTAFTWLLKPMLDEVFVDRDAQLIAWLPWVILLLFAARGAGLFLGDYSVARISRCVIRDLRQACFERYLGLPSSYFSRHPSGELSARLTYHVEQVGQTCTEGLKILILDSLTVIGLVGVMLYWSVSLTLMVLLIGPLIGLLVGYVGRRYRRISRRVQASMADVAQLAQDAVGAERDIKIYAAQPLFRSRFAATNRHHFGGQMKIAATSALSTATVQFLAALALALVILMATRPGRLESLSPGAFMSFISAMLLILPSLKRLTNVQSMIGRGLAAAESVFDLLDQQPEPAGGQRELTRARGDVRLEQVRMRYDSERQWALDGVDLDLPAGTVTALVGRSGSGKSTLAALLARFHDPDSGQIRLDGVPLSDYALADLRRQIALVSQNVVLFDDSIAANIALGSAGAATPAQIEAAARAAHVLEFAEQLPAGLDTRIGENGAQLSGGQRQRIALARAILKDAPILILDEATSALDNESERLIQAALAEISRGRTTLVIAHRLSTVEKADRVVVMDSGRIIEQGSHAELLAAGGAYAALYHSQLA